jgi:acetyl-CoA C-acetyltransferase
MPEAWIIDGVRTPRGRGKPTGALHGIHPQELLAQCLNALVERTGIDPRVVEDVVVGNAANVGDHGDCIARMSVLTAGWPIEVPAVTLNRFCGSGQQAVTYAAQTILAGHQEVAVGGGVESMSRSGGGVRPTLDGRNERLRARYPMVPQGVSADLIATLEGFTREDCDAFAVRSQDRAAKALAEGRFDRSLITVVDPETGAVALDHEEHPRPGGTVASLAGLPASFERMGTAVLDGYDRSFDDMCREVYPSIAAVEHVHHAGNSSGVVDGAGAVLLASAQWATAHGLAPRARVRMTATAGAEPVIMLTAPTPATRRVLAKAGMTADDIDLWEINEAFAAVPLKAMRDLDLDPEKVNVNGGAIALGHPIGATGSMLVQTVLDELERRDLTTGLVVMCTGGGMATATILERV